MTNRITHHIDPDGNIVIDALLDNNTYGAVINPRIINGRAYIRRDSIDTQGLDNPQKMKEIILSSITTQRGLYNEDPIIVED